ncbi:MAG: DUF6491 family protein [Pseudomonadota bacterium]|jgi:hypothetical protein|uniref:Uncharacterized protein n=1 Tax=hydrothermal vent metagenome TaxID=652676 RepID=A0A161KCW0_9ZZZZ
MRNPILLVLPLAAFCAVAATAQTPPAAAGPATPGKPATIPFVRLGGIYDFQADGDRAVYLQDNSRKWYHATILGPCIGLTFANRIGVKTRGTDSLDRFGSLLVDGQECQIDQLVTSGPPPKKAKKPKH